MEGSAFWRDVSVNVVANLIAGFIAAGIAALFIYLIAFTPTADSVSTGALLFQLVVFGGYTLSTLRRSRRDPTRAPRALFAAALLMVAIEAAFLLGIARIALFTPDKWTRQEYTLWLLTSGTNFIGAALVVIIARTLNQRATEQKRRAERTAAMKSLRRRRSPSRPPRVLGKAGTEASSPTSSRRTRTAGPDFPRPRPFVRSEPDSRGCQADSET
ncbi:hypothetical protein [Actinomycetospora atypica]|uniref:Uncharacterized protein n=1 Tax=Actinomycetospora atypica TaxID=1290095 RepID=A0ABV9YGX5_9PSEU